MVENLKFLLPTEQNFTSTEDKIIEVLNEGISDVLEQCWKDLTPISIKFHSREQNPQFAAFVESSDLVIVCSFVMQLPKMDSLSFDIVYPLQTLKPVSSLLRSRVQSMGVKHVMERQT